MTDSYVSNHSKVHKTQQTPGPSSPHFKLAFFHHHHHLHLHHHKKPKKEILRKPWPTNKRKSSSAPASSPIWTTSRNQTIAEPAAGTWSTPPSRVAPARRIPLAWIGRNGAKSLRRELKRSEPRRTIQRRRTEIRAVKGTGNYEGERIG